MGAERRAPLIRAGRSGGRQRREPMLGEGESAAELYEILGPPAAMTIGGAKLFLWDGEYAPPGNGLLHPDGDLMLAMRLSSEDLQRGETLLGQYHGEARVVEAEGLRPRQILASEKLSGRRKYANRPDFEHIAAEINAGWLKRIMWREVDRIARKGAPREIFFELLQEEGVELWLAKEGRAMNWEDDLMMLQVTGAFSEREAKKIVERFKDGLDRRWLDEGRGLPTILYIGTRRDERKFLVEDAHDMKMVHLAFETFAEDRWGTYGSGGLDGVRQHLEDLGWDISRSGLAKLLSNEVYVTGKWHVDLHDSTGKVVERVKGRDIEWTDPIPAELFERVQQIRQVRRGRSTRTPDGSFLLNSVELVHAPCRGRFKPGTEQPVRLRARCDHRGVEAARYRHYPFTPECCSRYTLPAGALDTAVVRALRSALVEHPELAGAWWQRMRSKVSPGSPLVDAPEGGGAARELHELEHQMKALEARWMDRVVAGEPDAALDMDDALAPLRARRRALVKRMEADKAKEARRVARAARGEAAAGEPSLRQAVAEILTDELPVEHDLRIRRAALVSTLVERVEVHDTPDGVELHIYGCLLDESQALRGPVDLPALVQQAGVLANAAVERDADGEVVGWREPAGTRVSPLAGALGERRAAVAAGALVEAAERERAAGTVVSTTAASYAGGGPAAGDADGEGDGSADGGGVGKPSLIRPDGGRFANNPPLADPPAPPAFLAPHPTVAPSPFPALAAVVHPAPDAPRRSAPALLTGPRPLTPARLADRPGARLPLPLESLPHPGTPPHVAHLLPLLSASTRPYTEGLPAFVSDPVAVRGVHGALDHPPTLSLVLHTVAWCAADVLEHHPWSPLTQSLFTAWREPLAERGLWLCTIDQIDRLTSALWPASAGRPWQSVVRLAVALHGESHRPVDLMAPAHHRPHLPPRPIGQRGVRTLEIETLPLGSWPCALPDHYRQRAADEAPGSAGVADGRLTTAQARAAAGSALLLMHRQPPPPEADLDQWALMHPPSSRRARALTREFSLPEALDCMSEASVARREGELPMRALARLHADDPHGRIGDWALYGLARRTGRTVHELFDLAERRAQRWRERAVQSS